MRRFVNIGVILSGIVLICVCVFSKSKIQNQYECMMDSEIHFPSSLDVIDGTNGGSKLTAESVYKFVVLIDSTHCSTCMLKYLPRYWAALQNFPLSKPVELVVIMVPKVGECEQIQRQIQLRHFPFDVFLDRCGDFLRDNPSIPNDDRFHVFLINDVGTPVVIGDPTRGEKMHLLYKESVQSL